MSKRLQVLLDEEEYDEIREAAQRRRMTVAEWVRQSLRQARSGEPRRPAEQKLAALERATGHSFPTGDIAQLLAEIDSGRASGLPR